MKLYCNNASLCIDTSVFLHSIVTALLEGFDIRESISFIEEHINRQVSHRFTHACIVGTVQEDTPYSVSIFFVLPLGLHDREPATPLSTVSHGKR